MKQLRRPAGLSLITFLVFAVGVGGVVAQSTKPEQAVPSHERRSPPTSVYTSSQYGFTVRYPSTLSPRSDFDEDYYLTDSWSAVPEAIGSPGTAVVEIPVVMIDHGGVATGQPYPLFFYAEMRVGVSHDTAGCFGPIASMRGPSPGTPVTLNGARFSSFPFGDAGMMKYLNGVSYRTVHDGLCFAVEQVETGSDYRDESMKPGLTDAQLGAYFEEAGKIARSFRFTDSGS